MYKLLCNNPAAAKPFGALILKRKVMTVKQLIKKLREYPEHMEVFIAERKTEFAYGSLNSVRKKEIPFSEEPDSKPLAEMECIILDEC